MQGQEASRRNRFHPWTHGKHEGSPIDSYKRIKEYTGGDRFRPTVAWRCLVGGERGEGQKKEKLRSWRRDKHTLFVHISHIQLYVCVEWNTFTLHIYTVYTHSYWFLLDFSGLSVPFFLLLSFIIPPSSFLQVLIAKSLESPEAIAGLLEHMGAHIVDPAKVTTVKPVLTIYRILFLDLTYKDIKRGQYNGYG